MHDHHHHHHMTPQNKASQLGKLGWVFVLTAGYTGLEVWGGYASGSLALLADAGHMLGDSVSLGVALLAVYIAMRPACSWRTFGYDRIEVLAALVNGVFLIIVASTIMYHAFERFIAPQAVQGMLMTVIAFGGLIVNLIAAKILHADQHHSINMRGAYLHVLSDMLGSVGAMAAGILILVFGWTWADPVIGILVALLVLSHAVRLVKSAVDILMEGSPAHVNIEAIEQALKDYPEVSTVHNLHVWSVNTDKILLTAHLVVKPHAFNTETLSKTQKLLKQKFGLSHVTLQLEVEN